MNNRRIRNNIKYLLSEFKRTDRESHYIEWCKQQIKWLKTALE